MSTIRSNVKAAPQGRVDESRAKSRRRKPCSRKKGERKKKKREKEGEGRCTGVNGKRVLDSSRVSLLLAVPFKFSSGEACQRVLQPTFKPTFPRQIASDVRRLRNRSIITTRERTREVEDRSATERKKGKERGGGMEDCPTCPILEQDQLRGRKKRGNAGGMPRTYAAATI